VCGKQIYKRPIQISANKGKVYCGQVCYGVSCRKEKACVVCGKSILASLNKKTCSRACSNTQRAGIVYGRERKNDKVKNYRYLKSILIEERGCFCERCKYSRGEILVVHHKNRNRTDNTLENLELICPNCHAEEHYSKNSWFWKGKQVQAK